MGTNDHHHHHNSDHSHHSHSHSHDHSKLVNSLDQTGAIKRIKVAFYLNIAFALIELIGGILIGSFAIIADAIHDFGDSLSLALALFLHKKSQLGPTTKLTYGYQRYSIISSLLSGTIIVAGSFIIIIESITHLFQNTELPNVHGMIALSILGILVNGLAAFGLSHGHSHNEKILSWHLIEDVLGWVAVLIGAICIKVFQVTWIDPLLAIAIAIFIMYNILRNLKEPLRIILQHTPNEQDLKELKHELEHLEGVHHLTNVHAWSLDGQQHVFSGCLKIQSPDNAALIKDKARKLIEKRGFHFITIEMDVDSHAHAHSHADS